MTDHQAKNTESFALKHERFLMGCDSQEELLAWDKDALGEMDVYYENVLITAVIRMVAADGAFSREEAELLQTVFAFRYSREELRSIHEEVDFHESDDQFVRSLREDLDRLESINERLCLAFRELVELACRIAMEIDGTDAAETTLAGKLIAAL